jgi:hypothetical protein
MPTKSVLCRMTAATNKNDLEANLHVSAGDLRLIGAAAAATSRLGLCDSWHQSGTLHIQSYQFLNLKTDPHFMS